MLAPHRLIIRLALAIIAVSVFAVAYLIALALEPPNLRQALTSKASVGSVVWPRR
jgi:hypothetical protein